MTFAYTHVPTGNGHFFNPPGSGEAFSFRTLNADLNGLQDYVENFTPGNPDGRIKLVDNGQSLGGIVTINCDAPVYAINLSAFYVFLKFYSPSDPTGSSVLALLAPGVPATGGPYQYIWSIGNESWTGLLASLAEAADADRGSGVAKLEVEYAATGGGALDIWSFQMSLDMGADYQFIQLPDGETISVEFGDEISGGNTVYLDGIDLAEEQGEIFFDTPFNLSYRPIRDFDVYTSPARKYQEFRK